MKRLLMVYLILIVTGVCLHGTKADTERVPQTSEGQGTGQGETETAERETKKQISLNGENNERCLRNEKLYKLSTYGARITTSKCTSSVLQKTVGDGAHYLKHVPARQPKVKTTKEEATKREKGSNDASDSSVSNLNHTYVFTITAYTAGYESTQKKKGEPGYGITATGTTVAEGRTIAADWGVLPPGTVVTIEGLQGQYVVEDKGGGVNGNHIDLFITDLDRAKKWGRQERKVRIIEWGSRK